jgi:hypothetical protein
MERTLLWKSKTHLDVESVQFALGYVTAIKPGQWSQSTKESIIDPPEPVHLLQAYFGFYDVLHAIHCLDL